MVVLPNVKQFIYVLIIIFFERQERLALENVRAIEVNGTVKKKTKEQVKETNSLLVSIFNDNSRK